MKVQRVRPIGRYAHGTEHFTEGLLVYGGLLLESTGLYGQSRMVYRTQPYLAEVARYHFDAKFFAEGICVAPDGGVMVLSFRENLAARWNVKEGRPEQLYDYDREGWGIAAVGEQYWTSDGSSTLLQRRHDLSPVGSTEVILAGEPLAGLNSLTTCHGSHILANIYGVDWLAEIAPDTGDVLTLIDATPLRRLEQDGAEVLNGTCLYTERSLLMTGKYWQWIHEVVLEPVGQDAVLLDEVIASMPRLCLPGETRLLRRSTYHRMFPDS